MYAFFMSGWVVVFFISLSLVVTGGVMAEVKVTPKPRWDVLQNVGLGLLAFLCFVYLPFGLLRGT